ncbi:hypothetical protein KY338_07135, partial [Candidatus Woesearchaeota archaeon]|nr:hypothetical protein [Candidatus Woesearchaeota archaeon]
MNKKILLLLMAVCIISAIAAFVYAGPAGHAGQCQNLVCSAATATSTAGSTQVINSTSGTVTTTTVTANATCTASGALPCFNLSNTTSWTFCNDTTLTSCDSKTTGYNLSTYTNTTRNLTYVHVAAGSYEALAFATSGVGPYDWELARWNSALDADMHHFYRRETGTPGTVSLGRPNAGDRPWYIFSERIPSSESMSGGDERAATTTFLNPNSNQPVSCWTLMQDAELSGDALDELCFGLIGKTANTIDAIGLIRYSDGSNNWMATGITTDRLGTPNGYIVGVQNLESSGDSVFDAAGTTITEVADTEDWAIITGNAGLNEMTDVSSNKDIAVFTGYTDNALTPESGLIVTYDMNAATVVDTFKMTDVDVLDKIHFYDVAVGYDKVESSRVYIVGGYGNNLFPILVTALINPTGQISVQKQVILDNVATTGSTRVVTNGADVVVTAPTATGMKVYNLDSEGNFKYNGKITLPATLASDVDQLTPLGIKVAGSAVYSAPTTTGSKVIVTMGSNIISVFEVNYTVDSGDILALNDNGGHTGDYINFILGGRTLDNHSVVLDFLNTSLGLDATNPNGTTRFTTDKQVVIATFAPNINILNFQLDFQKFNGTFDTTNGTCIDCSFDGANDPTAGGNGWCQAEVEKIWGMFQNYNLTITLTVDNPDGVAINLSSLHLVCRSFADTITINSNCTDLSNWTDSVGTCFTPN